MYPYRPWCALQQVPGSGQWAACRGASPDCQCTRTKTGRACRRCWFWQIYQSVAHVPPHATGPSVTPHVCASACLHRWHAVQPLNHPNAPPKQLTLRGPHLEHTLIAANPAGRRFSGRGPAGGRRRRRRHQPARRRAARHRCVRRGRRGGRRHLPGPRVADVQVVRWRRQATATAAAAGALQLGRGAGSNITVTVTAAAGRAPPGPAVSLVEVTNGTLVATLPLLPGASCMRSPPPPLPPTLGLLHAVSCSRAHS